jgi:hypothetical protein
VGLFDPADLNPQAASILNVGYLNTVFRQNHDNRISLSAKLKLQYEFAREINCAEYNW